jgi:hypothetical protein
VKYKIISFKNLQMDCKWLKNSRFKTGGPCEWGFGRINCCRKDCPIWKNLKDVEALK